MTAPLSKCNNQQAKERTGRDFVAPGRRRMYVTIAVCTNRFGGLQSHDSVAQSVMHLRKSCISHDAGRVANPLVCAPADSMCRADVNALGRTAYYDTSRPAEARFAAGACVLYHACTSSAQDYSRRTKQLHAAHASVAPCAYRKCLWNME